MVRAEKGPNTVAIKGLSGLLPSRSGSTQNLAANIKVVVRVRPLNDREREQHNRILVDVVDDKMLIFDPKEEMQPFFYQGVQQPSRSYLKRGNKELKFVFDHVCGLEATNNDVFVTTTKDMLSSLMEGYNCSVFVYGATGAGKTFTMIGNKENPGITYLTMEHLFYTINSFEKDRDFDIGVSYIEVYNENVFDLIKPSKTPLQLREDTKYGVLVAGLTRNRINTAQELLNLLENGNKNRTQHPTDANAESSRSHAVFQVYIKMSYKTSNQVRIVKLSMIDLAGSERASATGCKGDRFKEGANINKSLLSLANCINKLADGSSYIPYRDSKLTRLLKDSLGGNCKTVMIANVSPSSNSYEDTYNTLKYASRANKIQMSIKKNIVDADMRVSQYVKIIEELKKKNQELQVKLTLSSVQRSDRDADSKLAKLNEELKKERKKTEELEAKLSLSNQRLREMEERLSLSRGRQVVKGDPLNEKVKQEWRMRIMEEEKVHSELEQKLWALMSQQRLLALRYRLRTRAFTHVAELAHRSSTEAVDLMRTDVVPRQERAVTKYREQVINLDAEITIAQAKWDESRKRMQMICDQALSDCPELQDFVDKIQMRSDLRYKQAVISLKHKLLMLENEEINASIEYMTEMPNLLKKLYLTLKGYERMTPALTSEYAAIMKKAKSAKGITWSDTDCVSDDNDFKSISDLDLEKPTLPVYSYAQNSIIDSDDLTDIENQEPTRFSAKRKGTPIKLTTNETIIIDDSFESLDTTKTLNSAKKIKREFDPSLDVENCISPIKPTNLNSTFDMAGKREALKKSEPTKTQNLPVKRELSDKTNTMYRSINFNSGSGGGAKIVKPVQVGKALPVRRPPAPPPRSAGFGSSVSRDGTSLHRNIQGYPPPPSRHHALNDIIRRALESADVPCNLEPPGLSRTDGKSPDGLTLIPWERDRALLWDATCACTYAASHLPRTTRTAGAAAEWAASQKLAKYAESIRTHDFVPFAVETSGVWCSAAKDFVKKIGQRLRDRGNDPRAGSYLVQRISLAIVRGNAASVMGTFEPDTSRGGFF